MKETYLNLQNCKSNTLTNLPENMEVRGGLGLAFCISLKSLPEGLKVGGWLSLYNCKSLTSLPEDLEVGEDIYIRDSGITMENVPEHLRGKIVE